MDVLLGELSDIKAENGIQERAAASSNREVSSEVYFNVLEGNSSVVEDNETEGDRVIVSVAQEESEIAYENIIEQLIEEREQEDNSNTLDAA